LVTDVDGDGVYETTLTAALDAIVEDPGPTLISATTVEVQTFDPYTGEELPNPSQYGQMVSLLFSEEISKASSQAGLQGAQLTPYAVEANSTEGAALQPSGRIVTLLLGQGVGPCVPRSATALGIEDVEGHPMAPASQTIPITSTM